MDNPVSSDKSSCAKLAFSVYKKAWEGARKAVPRAANSHTKRPVSGPEDDLKSCDLDNEQPTECSSDFIEDHELRGYSLDECRSDTLRSELRLLESLATEGDEFGEEREGWEEEDIDLVKVKVPSACDQSQLNDKTIACVMGEADGGEDKGSNGASTFIDQTTLGSAKSSDSVETSGKEKKKTKKNCKKEKRSQDVDGEKPTESKSKRKMLFKINLKKSSESSVKDKKSPKLDEFATIASDQVMNVVKEEVKNKYKEWPALKTQAIQDQTDVDPNLAKGDGIFKVRAPLITEDMKQHQSQESTDIDQSSTIDIPTITISEDQLDDSSVVLSEATLRNDGSDDDFNSLRDDDMTVSSLKLKKDKLKKRMKMFGEKFRDIFNPTSKSWKEDKKSSSGTPNPTEYIDNAEEHRRRLAEKEEEDRVQREAEKRRREEQLEKKARELEMMAQKEEEERRRKEEEKKRKEEKKQREEEEKQRKEEERKRKEEEKRLKAEEEKRRKEEERNRKEEEKRAREEEERKKKEEEKKRKEEEKRQKTLEEKSKEEEERRRLEDEKILKTEEEKQREESLQKKSEDEKRRKEEKRKLRELERERKEEEKRQKMEEEKKRKEEGRNRKEKEKLRRQEEQMKKDEEFERAKQDEEKRRKELAQKKDEETKRKQDEKRKKMEEEAERKIEEERLKLEEMARKRLQEEEREQLQSLDESNESKSGFFSRKSLPASAVSVSEELKAALERFEDLNEDIRKSDRERVRRASTPSVPAKIEETPTSKVFATISQQTIVMRSDSGLIEPKNPQTTEEDQYEVAESEGEHEVQLERPKKMRKKLKDTKEKLISLKTKAIKSFPSVSRIKTRVKELLTFDEQNDSKSNKLREQQAFKNYLQRYPDSEGEFFSDSEVIGMHKNTRNKHSYEPVDENDFYDDIQTTADRVEMLFKPISCPLRPPRRSDHSFQSEPNISKKVDKLSSQVKRPPPPRPPPPGVGDSIMSISSTLEEVDLNSLDRVFRTDTSYLSRTQSSDRIPAHIFYRKVVENWRERNEKRLNLISQSSPNLCPSYLPHLTRPPRPGRSPSSMGIAAARPRAPIRRSVTSISKRFDRGPVNTSSVDTLPPLPPPRLRGRLNSSRSLTSSRSTSITQRKIESNHFNPSSDRADLATDPLFWKPFSWKTGRCRSLTEIYVRKRLNPNEPVEKSLSYRLTSQYCAPPRPPLPGSNNGTEPLYSTIRPENKTRKSKQPESSTYFDDNSPNKESCMQKRPLPAPPLPPRNRRKIRSRSSSPIINRGIQERSRTFIRSVSPFGIPVRDAAVDTSQDNIMAEKQVQTSFEDIIETLANIGGGGSCPIPKVSSGFQSLVAENLHPKTLTNPLAKSTELRTSIPSSTSDASVSRSKQDVEASKTSNTTYYDAEGCDTDLDVFAELDSYSEATLTSSQFHSLADPSDVSHGKQDRSLDLTPTPTPSNVEGLERPQTIGPRNSVDQNAVINSTDFTRLSSSNLAYDSEDDACMLQPRVTIPRELRGGIQRPNIGGRYDSMDNSDPEW